MLLYEFRHSGKDICQFFKRILYLPEVKHTHINIVRTMRIYTDNPETKNVGSGIYAQYDLVISQCNRIRYMDEEPPESRSCRPSGSFQAGQPLHEEERANCR